MKKHLMFIAICLLASYPAGAQIQIFGNLSGTLIDTTYHVTGHITVQEGDSLIIQPGAVLGFNTGRNFTIYGYLYAVGTEQDSIKFIKAPGVQYRGNILFYDSADDSSRMEYCLITGGRRDRNSLGSGGGIYCSHSSPTIDHCSIRGNHVDYDGGGIYCYHSSPTIDHCSIRGNGAGYSGGGIFCHDSNPTISHCVISGNTTSMIGGGGIYCRDSSPTITNCTISGNSGAMYAGGICCDDSSPTITNCTISGNTANIGGGIYCRDNSRPNFDYCTISGNRAGDGGGIYCIGGSPTLNHCTISGNTAGERGGGIYSYGNSIPTGVNDIIWANSAYGYSQIYGSFVCAYSDIQGGWGGTGNINADPLFYSTTGDSAYRLTADSPCIDTGDPNSPLDPDSTRADMGAYYYHQGLVVILTPQNPPVQVPAGGGSFDFTAQIENPTGNPMNFDAWIMATLPNGNVYGPIILRQGLSIGGGAVITRQLSQAVPAYAPSGNYQYVGKVGVYPVSVAASDSFPFTKLPGDALPNHNQGWTCSGWDEDTEVASIQHSSFSIHNSYPNPFNPSTAISFELRDAGFIKLSVYDIAGREVVTLAEGFYPAGAHQAVFDGTELASGVYFAMLEAGGVKQVRKLLLVK